MSKTTENYGLTKPEVGEFFSLETWNGNLDKIDEELKKREDEQKESDNSLMNPEFTEAKERKNLTSGEKIHLMLGKISKFFSDMKAIAFSGSYNDLVDKPKIPTVLNNQTTTEEGYALDARQANPNIDGTLAKQVADLNGSLNNIVFKDVSDKLDTDHVTGKMSAVNIGKIVMVYFDIIPKAVSDNTTILPTGTIPNAYVYAYHSMNTWGQSAIPDSLMAVRDDGSLAFWSGKDSIGTRIFDSFIYLSR